MLQVFVYNGVMRSPKRFVQACASVCAFLLLLPCTGARAVQWSLAPQSGKDKILDTLRSLEESRQSGRIGKRARAVFVSTKDGIALVENSSGVIERISLIQYVRWDKWKTEREKGKLETEIGKILPADYMPIFEKMQEELLAIHSSKSPLRFYEYSGLVDDLFGFVDTDNRTIVLHASVADNPVAVFHEVAEYLIRAGKMSLQWNAKSGELEFTVGSKGYGLDMPEKSKDREMAEAARDNPHYLLRALQHAIFGKADEDLSAIIEQEQKKGQSTPILIERERLPDKTYEPRIVPVPYTGPMFLFLGSKRLDVLSREDLYAHYPGIAKALPEKVREFHELAKLARSRATGLEDTMKANVAVVDPKKIEDAKRLKAEAKACEFFEQYLLAEETKYFVVDPQNPATPIPLTASVLKLGRIDPKVQIARFLLSDTVSREHAEASVSPDFKNILIKDEKSTHRTYYAADVERSIVSANMKEIMGAAFLARLVRQNPETGFAQTIVAVDARGRIIPSGPRAEDLPAAAASLQPASYRIRLMKKTDPAAADPEFSAELLDAPLPPGAGRVFALTLNALNATAERQFLQKALAFFSPVAPAVSQEYLEWEQKRRAQALWEKITSAALRRGQGKIIVGLDEAMIPDAAHTAAYRGMLKHLQKIAESDPRAEILVSSGARWRDVLKAKEGDPALDSMVLLTTFSADNAEALRDFEGRVLIAEPGKASSTGSLDAPNYTKIEHALVVAMEKKFNPAKTTLYSDRTVKFFLPPVSPGPEQAVTRVPMDFSL